jgi:hypothetical protein
VIGITRGRDHRGWGGGVEGEDGEAVSRHAS